MSMFGGLFNYLSKMEDPYRKPSKGLKNLICNTIANNIIYHTKDSYEPIFSYIYKYKLEILDDGYFFSTEIENTNPDKCSYHKMRRRGVFAGYAVSSNKSSPGWGRTTQIKIIGDTFRIGNRNKLKIKTSDLPNNNL